MLSKERHIVLLSGGLDSATCLYHSLDAGHEVIAVSFCYGQRHEIEIESAEKLAATTKVPHRIVPIPSELFKGSSLTTAMPVEKNRAISAIRSESEVPLTYVPARNLVFLSLATALAESENANVIVIGANCLDYSGYPDCRPEFLMAFEKTANLATSFGICGQGFHVRAPLLDMTKKEIVTLALKLNVPLEWTTSCYDPNPNGSPCLMCDSCQLRQQAFLQLKMKDPRHDFFRQSTP